LRRGIAGGADGETHLVVESPQSSRGPRGH
jgi:hypothetical protein